VGQLPPDPLGCASSDAVSEYLITIERMAMSSWDSHFPAMKLNGLAPRVIRTGCFYRFDQPGFSHRALRGCPSANRVSRAATASPGPELCSASLPSTISETARHTLLMSLLFHAAPSGTASIIPYVPAGAGPKVAFVPLPMPLMFGLGAISRPVESKMGAVAGGLWPSPRFPSPLIEPEVPISGVRLSDWLHRKAHDAAASGRRSRRSRPSSP